MATIEKRLWEGVLPDISKDNLYQVVRDFCKGSSCFVGSPIETAGHFRLDVWGITNGETKRSTLDPLIATITFYEPTKRLKVSLNDLESVQNPSEDLTKFLYDLPFGVRDRVEHLVWWILDKYVGRALADEWQQNQNLTNRKSVFFNVSKQPENNPQKLTGPQIIALGKKISDVYIIDELRALAKKLSTDYENLPGETRDRKAQELVDYANRYGRVSELVEILREERPLEPWSIETGH